MKSVLLRLEGPMQSWGTQSRFQERDTDAEPSKSGVLGLVGAALGMRRNDTEMLASLCQLSMAVRVDREGTLLRDYHTAGGGTWPGRKTFGVEGSGKTVLSNRYYLADASFLVALGTQADAPPEQERLLTRIERALAAPCFPLFLGRKAFAPSVPVHVPGGLVEGAPLEALRTQPFRPSEWHRESDNQAPAHLRLVVECGPGEGRPRDDVPLSFELYHRQFGRRYVRMDRLRTAELPPPLGA